MCGILKELPEPESPKKTVYVMHMPPAGLRLGQLLYQDLDIGSVDIYEFLKAKQPLLSLHGHIHESPDTEKGSWMNQIGTTTCIQPGQTEFGDTGIVVSTFWQNKCICERGPVGPLYFTSNARFISFLPYCSSVSAHFLCHYTFCKCQKLSLCKSFSIKLLFSSTLINQIVLKSGQMFIWQNEAPTIQSAAVVNQAVIHCCEHINIKVF